MTCDNGWNDLGIKIRQMFLRLIIKCEHKLFAKKTIIINNFAVARLIKQKRKNINSQNSIIIFIFIGGGEGLESLGV